MKNLLMHILEIAFCLNSKRELNPVFIPMPKTDAEMKQLLMKINSQNK